MYLGPNIFQKIYLHFCVSLMFLFPFQFKFHAHKGVLI